MRREFNYSQPRAAWLAGWLERSVTEDLLTHLSRITYRGVRWARYQVRLGSRVLTAWEADQALALTAMEETASSVVESDVEVTLNFLKDYQRNMAEITRVPRELRTYTRIRK